MRLLFSFLVLFLITFNFNGCSKNSLDTPNQSELSLQDQDSLDGDAQDDMLDDFEDEFKTKEVYDPLSGYNRWMTDVNDGLYTYVVDPIARGYRAVLHEEVRDSIGKFFHNLFYPIRLVNNLLQLKFKNAAEETGRFLVNSTVGIFGLFDPAKKYLGWEPHNEDFGQTLGFYGVGGGPHIVLPFIGPSNLRDMFSLYPDGLVDPTIYVADRSYNVVDNTEKGIMLYGVEKINRVSLDINAYQDLKKDAVDLYPFLRDIYEQYREKQIKE